MCFRKFYQDFIKSHQSRLEIDVSGHFLTRRQKTTVWWVQHQQHHQQHQHQLGTRKLHTSNGEEYRFCKAINCVQKVGATRQCSLDVILTGNIQQMLRGCNYVFNLIFSVGPECVREFRPHSSQLFIFLVSCFYSQLEILTAASAGLKCW